MSLTDEAISSGYADGHTPFTCPDIIPDIRFHLSGAEGGRASASCYILSSRHLGCPGPFNDNRGARGCFPVHRRWRCRCLVHRFTAVGPSVEEARMKDPLELPLRKRITEYIRRNPGVHFRQISRDMNLALGQLDFHLNALVKGDVLIKDVSTGNSRYYVRDRFSRDERRIMSQLRREIPRGIVIFLLENPDSTPHDILEAFTFTHATLSYHLKRLEKSGVITAEQRGRRRFYRVKDRDMVEMLLVMYRPSLLDTIVDSIS
ncbi:MAG: hypothetical protein DRN57_07350 [Thermoplasmata archaeon]|nr:MAG: hypothetical protein DRN57_07350 [Thermoplasmata archaeon]